MRPEPPSGLSVVSLLAAISLQSTSNTRELNLLSPDAFSRDKMVKNVLVAGGLVGTPLGTLYSWNKGKGWSGKRGKR